MSAMEMIKIDVRRKRIKRNLIVSQVPGERRATFVTTYVRTERPKRLRYFTKMFGVEHEIKASDIHRWGLENVRIVEE